jgi:sugar lactone lactonase YvrE
VARTPDEIAALERIRQKSRGQAATEAGMARGRGALPPRTAGVAELKPHMAIDGLRFDDSGRLWVRTMRGDHSRTILDVFAPGGAFLGEVLVPHAMSAFSFGGRWLAADVEWEDGTRRVMVWEVAAR